MNSCHESICDIQATVVPSVRLFLLVIMASAGSAPASSPVIPLFQAQGEAQASKSLNASFRASVKLWNSPQKYLLAHYDTDEKKNTFANALRQQLPFCGDLEYHTKSAMVSDTTCIVHPSKLGFVADCSPKLDVARETSIKIMEEIMMDGFVSKGDPLKIFQPSSLQAVTIDVTTPLADFSLGYVKSMNRACTLLCLLSLIIEDNCLVSSFPKLWQTVMGIYVLVEIVADQVGLAFQNAKLSIRGSIRKPPNVLTWMMM